MFQDLGTKDLPRVRLRAPASRHLLLSSPALALPRSLCFPYIIAKSVCQIQEGKNGRWKHFGFPPTPRWQILCHNTLTRSGRCFLFYGRWPRGVSVALKDCINFVIQVESPLLLLTPRFERFISGTQNICFKIIPGKEDCQPRGRFVLPVKNPLPVSCWYLLVYGHAREWSFWDGPSRWGPAPLHLPGTRPLAPAQRCGCSGAGEGARLPPSSSSFPRPISPRSFLSQDAGEGNRVTLLPL